MFRTALNPHYWFTMATVGRMVRRVKGDPLTPGEISDGARGLWGILQKACIEIDDSGVKRIEIFNGKANEPGTVRIAVIDLNGF